jgi:hypothetical protein
MERCGAVAGVIRENSRKSALTFSQKEGLARAAGFEARRATTSTPQGAIDILTHAAQPFASQNYCLTESIKDDKSGSITANRGVITKDHHEEGKMPSDHRWR